MTNVGTFYGEMDKLRTFSVTQRLIPLWLVNRSRVLRGAKDRPDWVRGYWTERREGPTWSDQGTNWSLECDWSKGLKLNILNDEYISTSGWVSIFWRFWRAQNKTWKWWTRLTRARYEKEVTKLTSEVKVQVTTCPFDLTELSSVGWDRLEVLPNEDYQDRMKIL